MRRPKTIISSLRYGRGSSTNNSTKASVRARDDARSRPRGQAPLLSLRGGLVPKRNIMRVRHQIRLLLALYALSWALPAACFSPVAAKHGMVASSEPFASEAGGENLQAGGNAREGGGAGGVGCGGW